MLHTPRPIPVLALCGPHVTLLLSEEMGILRVLYDTRELTESDMMFFCDSPSCRYAIVAHAVNDLPYLQKSIGVVLAFIGAKLFAETFGVSISNRASLLVRTIPMSHHPACPPLHTSTRGTPFCVTYLAIKLGRVAAPVHHLYTTCLEGH